MQDLLDLEILAIMCEEIIMSLTVEDYFKGPFEDKLDYLGEIWEFGKSVKKKEVYIINKELVKVLNRIPQYV